MRASRAVSFALTVSLAAVSADRANPQRFGRVRLPWAVLVVRPHDGKADLHRQPDLGHILLPLDGTAHAERIIEPAV
jgi:hypothetical protein